MSRNLMNAWALRRKMSKSYKKNNITYKEQVLEHKQSIKNSSNEEVAKLEIIEDAKAEEAQDTDYDGQPPTL